MTWPQLPPDDAARPAFLVERYISSAAVAGLVASSIRLAQLCADPGHTSHQVRYLGSAYLPSEETCFCLFRAPSAEAVRAVNDRAGFAFDRIIDAIELPRSVTRQEESS